MRIHTYIHTYTYIRAYVHTHIYTYTHTHTYIYIYITIKVHGGVTEKDIKRRIGEAKVLAKHNYAKHRLSTILFLDEANTTDGIGLIKEIMVDERVHGKPLTVAECGLEIIAACNPYRR